MTGRHLASLLVTAACLTPAWGQGHGRAGVFDYYSLVLSWSPEFCHGKPNDVECTAPGPKTFVVHGLWPEYNRGYPQHCPASQPAPTNATLLKGLMPDEIVEHEWETHGTCSGLKGDDYFALIRHVAQSVRMPPQLANPQRSSTMRPGEIKDEFLAVNPQLRAGEIVVNCSGNYLKEVKVCFNRSGIPQDCPQAAGSCHSGTIVVPAWH